MRRNANNYTIVWGVAAVVIVMGVSGCAAASPDTGSSAVVSPTPLPTMTVPPPTSAGDKGVTTLIQGEGTGGSVRINLNTMVDGMFSVGGIEVEVTCVKAQAGRSGATSERDGIVARIGGVITASDSEDPTLQPGMVRWIDVADFGPPTADNPTPDRFVMGRAPQDSIEANRVRQGNCAAPPANNIYQADWQSVEGDFDIQMTETP